MKMTKKLVYVSDRTVGRCLASLLSLALIGNRGHARRCTAPLFKLVSSLFLHLTDARVLLLLLALLHRHLPTVLLLMSFRRRCGWLDLSRLIHILLIFLCVSCAHLFVIPLEEPLEFASLAATSRTRLFRFQ